VYILKRGLPNGKLAYLKRSGWVVFPKDGPLDLTDCVLFTDGETKTFQLNEGEVFQFYGAYKCIEQI
jgi:hypothetical protein